MGHEGKIGKECETKRENNKRVTKVKIKEKIGKKNVMGESGQKKRRLTFKVEKDMSWEQRKRENNRDMRENWVYLAFFTQ